MNVEQFQYLDRIMSMDDNDVPAMRRNLKRAQKTMGGVEEGAQGGGGVGEGRDNVLLGSSSVAAPVRGRGMGAPSLRALGP